MPTAPKKTGTLTNAPSVPEIPSQAQGTGTIPRRSETAPAQATTNGANLSTNSKPKK